MKKAIIYLFEFIAIQLIGGFLVKTLWRLLGGSDEMSTALLITTTSVVSVVTIVVFLLTHAAEVSPTWLRSRPWAALFWCVLAAFGCIIPSVWLQELMPELPNLVEQEFDMVLRNRWGYLTIGLLAPLSEELVLRGAVLRSLLRSSRLSPWGAIAISAVLFALVHFNPAQMPHAFIIGLLLGWMYYRTDSILPGVAFHWVNNSIAYVLYNLYPNPQMKLIDFFGSQRTVAAALLFSLFILLPAIYQLHLRLKKADE
jgi:hypothetical protein